VYGQAQRYPLSCEARSAVDWAAYFGTTISEEEFLALLTVTDNPETGFVGYPWDLPGRLPPNSYGVHPPPVAAALRAYGLPASEVRMMSYEHLQREVAAGQPVIAWVIAGLGLSYSVPYTASDGSSTWVAPYEHTVLVIGYSPEIVTVLDGAQVYSRTVPEFLDSWAILGYRAIIWE
jgi:uncharacterized protein YvpB